MTFVNDRFIARHWVSAQSKVVDTEAYHDVGEDASTRPDQTSNTGQEHIVQHETLGDESEARVGIQYRNEDGHIGTADCSRSRPTFSEGQSGICGQTSSSDQRSGWCHGEESCHR
jgi:hypothetical protein